jgi:hypothetical protein
MSFAVTPWTGSNHEVCGQFPDDHLDLHMGGLTKDTCEDRMRHLCLIMPLAETALEGIVSGGTG